MRAWDQGLVSVGTQQHSIGQTMQQVDSNEQNRSPHEQIGLEPNLETSVKNHHIISNPSNVFLSLSLMSSTYVRGALVIASHL